MQSGCHKTFTDHITGVKESKYVLILKMHLTQAFVFPTETSCVCLSSHDSETTGLHWHFKARQC